MKPMRLLFALAALVALGTIPAAAQSSGSGGNVRGMGQPGDCAQWITTNQIGAVAGACTAGGGFIAGGDLSGSSSVQTVIGLRSIALPTLAASTGYFYDANGTLSLSTSASNFTTGTLPHAQLPTLVSGDIPNNAANTSGQAGTALALAASPTLCTTGNAPTGILANGNATGCAAIGGGGSGAFSSLTSGTNTTAAMVVGTGASLAVSGSGTIAATTAAALAANPTDCSSGQYANAIDASGNLTCAAVTDAQLSTSNITTNNVSTSKHGFAPILPNDATKFLDGTGAYSTPAGTGTINSALQFSIPNYSASGTANTLSGINAPTTPNGVPQSLVSTPSGSAATAFALALPGVVTRAIGGTTATDTTLATDCNPGRVAYQGSVAVAVTLPTATTLAVANCVTRLTNTTSGSSTAVTVTPTTWTVNGGSTLAIAQGRTCTFYVDPAGGAWDADCSDLPFIAGTGITITRGQFGATISSASGGTVTSIATTSPLAGGTITTTGTLSCPTCGITGSPLSQFAATTSAQLASVISDETGTGLLVYATAPTMTLTNATGLPISTGVSGLGTGVATFLGTPSSANLAAAITDETGTGLVVFATGPTITLANATGLPTAGLVNNAVTSAKMAVVNTYRTCDVAIGDTTAAALVNGQLGPQSRICFIPAAATIVEMDVNADAGTPNIIIGRNRAGTIVNIVSTALATAASGGIACSNTGGTTGLNGATTCSATLQNTGLTAGDYIEAVSGTAGGTAKFFVAHIIYTVN